MAYLNQSTLERGGWGVTKSSQQRLLRLLFGAAIGAVFRNLMERAIQFSELDLIERYVAGHVPGVFVDVGAHIGGFSTRFAALGWRVHAFEPDPSNYADLAHNLAGYEQAKAVQNAVSNETGESIVFYLSTEFWGIHSLAPFDKTHTDTIEVPVTRLDDYVAANAVGHVDVLKVDTEGADKLVLEGFDFNKDQPDIVVAEFMDSRSKPHFGYSHHDVVMMMADHGYDCFVADWAPVVQHSRREGGGGPFTFLNCVPYPTPYEPSWGNLIFVPHVSRDEFAEVLHDYLIELNADIQDNLRRNGGLVDGLTRKVEQQADRIVILDAAIVQRDARREELHEAVTGRDARVDELEYATAARDARLDAAQSAIDGRDTRIGELDAAIVGRDDRITELDAAIAQRDSRIEHQGLALRHRDERIAQLEHVEADLVRSESRLDDTRRDRDATRAEAVSLRTETNRNRRYIGILSVIAALLAIAALALALSG